MAIFSRVKGLDKVTANLGKLKTTLTTSSLKSAYKIGQEIKQRAEDNIFDADLVNNGDLWKGLYVTPPVKTSKGYTVEIGNTEKHAIYHHEGWDKQKSSSEMFSNIEEWAMQKLGVSEEESYIITSVIVNNLVMSGHVEEPFLQEAVDQYSKKIPKKIRDVIKDGLRKIFAKIRK